MDRFGQGVDRIRYLNDRLLMGRRHSVDLFEDFFELALIHSRPPSECVQLLDPSQVPSTENPLRTECCHDAAKYY